MIINKHRKRPEIVHEETTKSRLRNQLSLAQIERLDAQKPILKQGVSIKSKYICSTVVLE